MANILTHVSRARKTNRVRATRGSGPLRWDCASAWPGQGGWGRKARRGALACSAAPLPERLRPQTRPRLGILSGQGSARSRSPVPRGTAVLQVSLLLSRVAGWPTGRGGHGGAGSREGAGRRPSLSGADRRLLLPQSALASAAAGKRSGHRRRRQAVPEFGVPARPLERPSLSRLGFCFLPKPRSPEAAGGKAERKKSSADSAGWDEGSLVRSGLASRAPDRKSFTCY